MSQATPRERMVARIEEQGIGEPRVLAAMQAVPREEFVDDALRSRAYEEDALPIGDRQTISQPWIVARMTELLLDAGGESTARSGTGRVLEIGTGSGYHAAVLAHVFEQVYTVERNLELSRRAQRRIRRLGLQNVHFKVFDGSYGWGEFAPYRGILVTAAVPEVPSPLLPQLADGGALVLPRVQGGRGPGGGAPATAGQTLVKMRKQGTSLTEERHGRCQFVPLIGRFGWKA